MKIYSSSRNRYITVSKSELEEQLKAVFRGSLTDPDFDPVKEFDLNIDIYEDQGGVVVEVAAEYYFDHKAFMDYSEYKSLIDEFGGDLMSSDEFYARQANKKTMEEKMTEVLRSYNPDWYFELYDACHIQAFLDDCNLVA